MALKGLKKRPYVINVVHGYLFQEDLRGLKSKILLFCEKLVRRQTDDLVVMNQEDWRIANKYKLCQRRVFGVSGMGIPDAFSKPIPDGDLRERFVSSEEDYLCTFVGELSNRKNQSFLIHAVKRLREEQIPMRLCLVGDGENKERLKEEICSLGLEDSVFLPGSTASVGDYLSITDLYVSASVSEGLPFNIMEAMAYGLPIVASDVKGQRDLLENVPQGLYPLNDMDAFCRSVKEFYNTRGRGVQSMEYPNLAQYRLSAVFGSVMRIYLRGVRANDADN
jgi:glycosyltransferase EpsD